MPLYDYKCECGERKNDMHTGINEYPMCSCGKIMHRVFSKQYVVNDVQPYLDHHIGAEPTWIKSKQHRAQVMKQNGLCEKFGEKWI